MTLPATPDLTLVLGGARSGKSRHAEAFCLANGRKPIYLATAQALDAEMAARVAHHRITRDPCWTTVEEPLDLSACLRAQASKDRIVLVECLTLWLTNLMVAERDVTAATIELLDILADPPGSIVLVSNEVGLGVVPMNAMARAFVDHAGRLHQEIAALAQTVTLVTAGIPLPLKVRL